MSSYTSYRDKLRKGVASLKKASAGQKDPRIATLGPLAKERYLSYVKQGDERTAELILETQSRTPEQMKLSEFYTTIKNALPSSYSFNLSTAAGFQEMSRASIAALDKALPGLIPVKDYARLQQRLLESEGGYIGMDFYDDLADVAYKNWQKGKRGGVFKKSKTGKKVYKKR